MPDASMCRVSARSAILDAFGTLLNMDSPKKARPIAMPYTPPTRRSASQISIECAQPSRCSRSKAIIMSPVIQVPDWWRLGPAQSRMTSAKDWL